MALWKLENTLQVRISTLAFRDEYATPVGVDREVTLPVLDHYFPFFLYGIHNGGYGFARYKYSVGWKFGLIARVHDTILEDYKTIRSRHAQVVPAQITIDALEDWLVVALVRIDELGRSHQGRREELSIHHYLTRLALYPWKREGRSRQCG